jgi:hypothetical protein
MKNFIAGLANEFLPLQEGNVLHPLAVSFASSKNQPIFQAL